MTHQDRVYKVLAKEYPLSAEVIEKICRFQFKFAAEQIGSQNYNAVRLPFWGVYKPLPKRLKRYLTKHNLQDEEQYAKWFVEKETPNENTKEDSAAGSRD